MEEDFEGLPPGPGRAAVYFTCTACHSSKQFTQQRMDREDWDQAISRMVHDNKMAAPRPWARTLMLAYLSSHFGVDDEDWAGLPPGPGREEVFYLRKQELRGSVDASQPDFKALVAERRADRDRWMRVLPPSSIGEGKVMPNPQTDGFFGPADVEPGGPGTVNGLAGSPGIVRGTARLVLSRSEVDRLQPGDILVTYA
ncbi:MAG: hypothetical protein IIC53_08050 [Proteobacteria bacterium]|nr:hypothetical protein [Pseudomonadota bacterium]